MSEVLHNRNRSVIRRAALATSMATASLVGAGCVGGGDDGRNHYAAITVAESKTAEVRGHIASPERANDVQTFLRAQTEALLETHK